MEKPISMYSSFLIVVTEITDKDSQYILGSDREGKTAH